MTLKNEAENAAAMLRRIRDSGNVHQIAGIPIADIKDMIARLEAATNTKDGMDVERTPLTTISKPDLLTIIGETCSGVDSDGRYFFTLTDLERFREACTKWTAVHAPIPIRKKGKT